MAAQLVKLGVPVAHIYPEGFSDDTIGNAFFARAMHAEHAGWRRLLLITSQFQARRESHIVSHHIRSYHITQETQTSSRRAANPISYHITSDHIISHRKRKPVPGAPRIPHCIIS